MIDWFTLGAQLINFLILVALLKHFLYGPIVRAMTERRQNIESQLEEAETIRQEAEQRASEYRQKAAEFDRERQELMERAKKEAQEERKARVREAREEADRLSREWKAAVQQEKASFLGEVRRDVGRQSVAVARKALADLADASLQGRLTASFLDRLQDLGAEERAALAAGMQPDGAAPEVRMSFDPSDEDRRRIQDALRGVLDQPAEVRFTRDEGLICGIEVVAGGRKVGWTLAEYLEAVAGEIEHALNEAGPVPGADEDAGNHPS